MILKGNILMLDQWYLISRRRHASISFVFAFAGCWSMLQLALAFPI